MERSSDHLNLEHLKKQAKDLIRQYRKRDPKALARLRTHLPAGHGRSDDARGTLRRRRRARRAAARGPRRLKSPS